MISLYKYVQEGLLGDFEDLDKAQNKTLGLEWLKENATGKYKTVVMKDGGIKVRGDLVIKGCKDETFPAKLVFVSGDVVIEKCPNLITLDGFFDRYMKYEGNLSIGNCPKLTNLGACPFSINGSLSIVGNSSLKSLEGAPELVGGRVYIMKNGKKFTEENIKRIIHIATKIVCSIDLDGDIIEESSINEALNEPHLLELVKQLKDNKIDVKKFFNSKTIPWDQIDAAHVKEYPNIDAKAKTVARNVIAGRDGIKGIILLRNSEDKYTYAISNSKDFIELDRDLVSSWRGEPYWKDYSSTELMWMVENSRSMVVITWDSDFVYNRIKMHAQRRDSRLGMVLNTPEYYEEVARENIRRYKKIIAMNKAKRDDEIEKIDKDIELIMNKSLKMVQGIRQTPTSGASWMNSSKVDNIFDSIYNQSSYGGKIGLLVLYNKFLREYMHVRDNGDSYRERNMNEYKKLLLQKIKTIKSQLGL